LNLLQGLATVRQLFQDRFTVAVQIKGLATKPTKGLNPPRDVILEEALEFAAKPANPVSSI
jgi:hypothetical protein